MKTNSYLKIEFELIQGLGFEEIKPLLFVAREEAGTIYFDYRKNNKRKTYAVDNNNKTTDKNHFAGYVLFHNFLNYRLRDYEDYN